MTEVIILVILFLILLVMEYQDRKNIAVESYKSRPHSIVYVLIFIAMIALFRTDSMERNIQLFVFAFFVLNFGLQKEGLGKEKFVKSGYVFSSAYKKYKIVEIKPYLEESSQIKFKKSETDNGVSMMIEGTPQKIKQFFENSVKNELTIKLEEE